MRPGRIMCCLNGEESGKASVVSITYSVGPVKVENDSAIDDSQDFDFEVQVIEEEEARKELNEDEKMEEER
eukprot:CAMPEP_0202963370 /NCGR_PEP_ID=MMETSP1396-20130829/7363_1 /ASSEMBLY_ACC=CAM_ASM_000872 /TAXON_ID= /ORGANISM="Pseudokeronopsis sp., Strain Brazil" /LENGTH=70 /DNA_ID=CAMNT_0049684527 /DNA_START=169 /DNA_END=381 /DNA_ORIENTATION=+